MYHTKPDSIAHIDPREPDSLTCKLTKQLTIISLIASLTCFNMGYNLAVSNLMATYISNCSTQSSVTCIELDEFEWSLIIGIIAIGALIGSLLSGYSIHRLGYKKSFFIPPIIYIIGGILLASAYGFLQLLIGRILIGIAIGFSTVILPTYLGDIATIQLHGAISSLTCVAISLGYFVSMILGIMVEKGINWRIYLAFIAVIGFVQLILTVQIIESPKTLVLKKELSLAGTNLKLLREGYNIENEMKNILLELNEERNPTISYKTIFKDKTIFHNCLLAISLICFQEICGISALLFYSLSILQQNLSPTDAYSAIIGVAAITLLASLVTTFIVDKFHRKTLLLLGAIIQTLAWLVVLIAAYFKNGIVQIVAILVFIVFYNFGLLSLSYIMLPELVPKIYLDFISGIALCLNWIISFLVTLIFPLLLSYAGWLAFLGFVITNTLFLLMVLFYVPK